MADSMNGNLKKERKKERKKETCKQFPFPVDSCLMFSSFSLLYRAGSLAPSASVAITLGIDFNDTTQPANFDLW